jgi:hypothetical protein
VSGLNGDYYIALGLIYNDRYEFPEKKFFWCSSQSGMKFQQFPLLNDQHIGDYNDMAN